MADLKQLEKRKAELKKELKEVTEQITKAQNEDKPTIYLFKELKSFCQCYNDGAQCIYEGVTYQLRGMQELIEEYGFESVDQGFESAKLEDLVEGGRMGILEIVK